MKYVFSFQMYYGVEDIDYLENITSCDKVENCVILSEFEQNLSKVGGVSSTSGFGSGVHQPPSICESCHGERRPSKSDSASRRGSAASFIRKWPESLFRKRKSRDAGGGSSASTKSEAGDSAVERSFASSSQDRLEKVDSDIELKEPKSQSKD